VPMDGEGPCVTRDELWPHADPVQSAAAHARAPERRLLDYFSSNSPTGSGSVAIQRRVQASGTSAVSCESQDRDAYGDGFMHGDWGG
jgi:hypothetical protein